MKKMTEQKTIRYEALPKPEIKELLEVKPNTEDFENPEKAEALIKNLKLQIGDTIQENGEDFIINPRMILNGTSPNEYKTTIENLKKILTKQEIKNMSRAINKNTKDYNKKLYDKITKRTDEFYYRHEIKKTIPKEIKEVLEFFRHNNHTGVNNTIYHLLSKGKEDFLMCYKTAWKNQPIPDQREWREENDGEYVVLTDTEADDRFDDYIDEDYWKEAVKSGNTTQGFDDWKEEVKRCDGRGNSLNSYDGREEVEEINGTEYFIYRTN
jgi:hypothetical protein